MALFRGRFRVETIRARDWDYRWPGCYFVTICTAEQRHFLGEVAGGRVQLSPLGIVAREHLLQVPSHYGDVALDAFVVMPNHVHAIVVLAGYKVLFVTPIRVLVGCSAVLQSGRGAVVAPERFSPVRMATPVL